VFGMRVLGGLTPFFLFTPILYDCLAIETKRKGRGDLSAVLYKFVFFASSSFCKFTNAVFFKFTAWYFASWCRTCKRFLQVGANVQKTFASCLQVPPSTQRLPRWSHIVHFFAKGMGFPRTTRCDRTNPEAPKFWLNLRTTMIRQGGAEERILST